MKYLRELTIAALLLPGLVACGQTAPTILNAVGPSDAPTAPIKAGELAGRMRRSANRLVAEFVDGARVDYAGLATSDAFAEYKRLAEELTDFDPATLVSREQRLEFWINLYNALIMHSVLASGVEGSVREESRFFDRYAYVIGGHTFTPNAIEHGVLRGAAFELDDPRTAYVVEPLDPRLHFALNCASAGCPPISAYRADRIDDQLDVATIAFVNSPSEVHVDMERGVLHVSRIFHWYADDFGAADDAALRFILEYMDPGTPREYLEGHIDSIGLSFNDYDWRLNH